MALTITMARFLAGQAAKKGAKMLLGRVYTPVFLTYKGLEVIDSELEKQCLDFVRKTNGLPGKDSPIALIKYRAFGGKVLLVKNVEEHGGTAWVQTTPIGKGRLESFWHPSKSFRPKGSNDSSLGHIVHGSRNNRYWHGI